MAVVHEAQGQFEQALALAKQCLDVRIQVSPMAALWGGGLFLMSEVPLEC